MIFYIWNSYFNIREDETQPYGAIQLANYRLGVSATPILYEEYRNMFLVNSKKIKLTGPSKKDIVLPILKNAGKQAAIALCEKYLPLPAVCAPAIESLIP